MKKSLILLAVLLFGILLVIVPTPVKSTPPTVNLSFTESFISGINPDSVTVNQGDLLNITVTNNDPSISHTFTVDGYVSYSMAPSQVRNFNFTATHTGSFLIHCLIHPEMPTSTLKVQGPLLTASPTSRNVTGSGSATYNLTVSSIGTYNGNVSLSIQGSLTGVIATFQRATILIPASGSNSSILTLNVAAAKPAGTYNYNITAQDRTFFSSLNITLQVKSPSQPPKVPVFPPNLEIFLAILTLSFATIMMRRSRSTR